DPFITNEAMRPLRLRHGRLVVDLELPGADETLEHAIGFHLKRFGSFLRGNPDEDRESGKQGNEGADPPAHGIEREKNYGDQKPPAKGHDEKTCGPAVALGREHYRESSAR